MRPERIFRLVVRIFLFVLASSMSLVSFLGGYSAALILTNEENIQIIKNSNYSLIDSFILPESSWWNNYYVPYEKQISALKKKYQDNKEKISFLDSALIEIELFRKYSKYYGYIFYIMQNQDF